MAAATAGVCRTSAAASTHPHTYHRSRWSPRDGLRDLRRLQARHSRHGLGISCIFSSAGRNDIYCEIKILYLFLRTGQRIATTNCISLSISPVHVPLAHGPGKGRTTFGLLYTAFPCISARGCFQDLNP